MRKKVPEIYYRSSRICRVLGNPTAYEILKTLAKGERRPSEIAGEFKLTIPTISDALKSLRQLDLVRYETRVDGKAYFIKDKMIITIMSQLEILVKRIKTVDY